MKRGAPLRRTRLSANPAKVAVWQRRTRKRLPARSAKATAAVETRRDVVVAVHLRDGYRCQAEARWPEVTCGGALHCHEPLPRSRGGDPLDVGQCITICAAHHSATHQHPTLARARGLTL